ncbi:MAG: haloacid dehalogenase [Anaerolineae bacterium]|nr:haloacid dehalogenase [Anaerolineae bacterium]
MERIIEIVEQIHQAFEVRNRARDTALAQARQLTRYAAHAIRAIHRGEFQLSAENLEKARQLVAQLREDLKDFPELYHAGYTQDAIKEFCEAAITSSLIQGQYLPGPEELNVEYASYMNGMAEVPGELRRKCMDILRQGYSEEAEVLLQAMDEIYAALVTMDYPDAITNGLRRQTDLVRGIVERTRGDLTISLREEKLKRALEEAMTHFKLE